MSNHETPSYNQLSEQYKSGHDEPTVLIRRGSNGDGEIQTAALTNDRDDQGRRYVSFSEDGKDWFKPILDRNLTDDHQALLASELAGSREQLNAEHEQLITIVKSMGREATSDALAPQPQEIEVSHDKPQVKLRPEDIDHAVKELNRGLNPRLEAIFRGMEATPEARRAAIDPNDGSQEMRGDLENLLRVTIDQIGGEGKLPERVQRNDLGDLKSVADHKLGYEQAKYPPRDYAAKVALAVLDGSFRGDPRKPDYGDLPADDPRNGQHRQAAIMALDRLMSDKKSEVETSEDLGESVKQARRLISELVNSDELNRAEILIYQDQIDPSDLVHRVSGLQNSIDELRSRIGHLSPENANEESILMQSRDQLTVPAHMVGDAYNDVLRWSRYLEEQGDSPGIRNLRDEIVHQLGRAIQQLKQIQ